MINCVTKTLRSVSEEEMLWAWGNGFVSSVVTSGGSYLYDLGNCILWGAINKERYEQTVSNLGNRWYNIARARGFSDEQIAAGIPLTTTVLGDVLGTNMIAEGVTGYSFSENEMLDGFGRLATFSNGVASLSSFGAGIPYGAARFNKLRIQSLPYKTSYISTDPYSKLKPLKGIRREVTDVLHTEMLEYCTLLLRTRKFHVPDEVLEAMMYGKDATAAFKQALVESGLDINDINKNINAFDKNCIYQVKLNEDIKVYRYVNSNGAKRIGSWWSFEPFDPINARETLAILPDWSDMKILQSAVIPKGTTIFVGPALKQYYSEIVYRGGQIQIFVTDRSILHEIKVEK